MTPWRIYANRIRDRATEAPVTEAGCTALPDPPDRCDELPGWLDSWERYATRRRAEPPP